MLTFQQFVTEHCLSENGVNLLFESGMLSVVNSLERIVKVFRDAEVPFEIIGGVATNAHLLQVSPSAMFVTRNVNVLMQRSDLEALVKKAEQSGYNGKKMMGGYALLLPNQELGEAVHIIFAGEKSRSNQIALHPQVNPETLPFYGMKIPFASMSDLLKLKLTSFRPKDIGHLDILDDVKLITPELEESLSPEFREKLAEARRQNEATRADL